MEGVKIVVNSFRGFFVWLLAILGIEALSFPYIFGWIVTVTVGANAIFTLRNHIKKYLSEK